MTATPEKAIRAVALAASGVTALIAQRWYAEFVLTKDIKYPLVVCDVAKSEPVTHLTGASGFTVDSIDLSVWGESHDSVEAVAAQLRIALSGYKASVTIGSDTVEPTIILDSQDPCTTSPIDGGEFPIFGITQHYRVGMAQATS